MKKGENKIKCYNCDKIINNEKNYILADRAYCKKCKDLLFPNEEVDYWISK